MQANHNLGLAYQLLNNMDMAIQYHVSHRDSVVHGREALNEGATNMPDGQKTPRGSSA